MVSRHTWHDVVGPAGFCAAGLSLLGCDEGGRCVGRLVEQLELLQLPSGLKTAPQRKHFGDPVLGILASCSKKERGHESPLVASITYRQLRMLIKQL